LIITTSYTTGISQFIYITRNKLPTATWTNRNKLQIVSMSPYEIKEAYFGYSMVSLAKATKAFMLKHMNPSLIPKEELNSGKTMNDFWYTLLEKILWPADCLIRANKSCIKIPALSNNNIQYSFFSLIKYF